MINLYQILQISPYASRDEIVAALRHYQNQANADPKIAQATEKWLLTPDIRARYNARLQETYPAFFQVAHDDEYVVIEEDETLPETPNSPNQAPDDAYYVPVLWNPKALAIWSFFLTPAFGAWLTALNWQALGDDTAQKINMQAAYAVIGASLLLAIVAIVTGADWGWLLQIVMWAAWFFTLGKKQLDFVDSTVGDNYNRRLWQKPLLFTLLAWLAYVLVIMLLMYLAIKLDWAHPSLFES